jgi:hypothetical protein
MIVTVALETDERLRVIQDITALGEFGRVLVISVPEAEYWRILGGTVVGVGTNGALQHMQGSMILRDDSATLRLIAALAAEICGSERQAISVTSRTLTDYKPLGTLLTSNMTSALGSTVHGVVTSVSWDGRALTALTRTEFMELDFVSLATGLLTTAGYNSRHDLARAVKNHERAIAEIRRDTANMDVRREPPRPFDQRYEEFAAAEENYATVDELATHDDMNYQGTFDLYREQSDPSTDERRVLIHSDHVYGADRQIERLIFDIPCVSSAWVRSTVALATAAYGQFTREFVGKLYVKIRPIIGIWNPSTEEWEGDFDPAAITWDDAYMTTPLNFGTQATILFVGEITAASVLVLDFNGPGPPQDNASAEVHEMIKVPGLFHTKNQDILAGGVLADWNAEDKIYGWEIALDTDGCGVSAAYTSSGLGGDPVRCFVIRK